MRRLCELRARCVISTASDEKVFTRGRGAAGPRGKRNGRSCWNCVRGTLFPKHVNRRDDFICQSARRPRRAPASPRENFFDTRCRSRATRAQITNSVVLPRVPRAPRVKTVRKRTENSRSAQREEHDFRPHIQAHLDVEANGATDVHAPPVVEGDFAGRVAFVAHRDQWWIEKR